MLLKSVNDLKRLTRDRMHILDLATKYLDNEECVSVKYHFSINEEDYTDVSAFENDKGVSREDINKEINRRNMK